MSAVGAKRIAILGDSHAQGLSLAGLTAALNAAGYAIALFETHPGRTTAWMLENGVFARAIAAHPDVIVVVSGHNDPETPRSELAMTDALALLRGSSARVVWLLAGPSTIRHAEAQRRAARDRLRRLAPGILADGADGVSTADLAGDGIHYTRAGYVKLGTFLLERLRGRSLWLLWSLGGLVAGGLVAWYFGRRR